MEFDKDRFRGELEPHDSESEEALSKKRRADNPSSHDEDLSEYDKTLADSFPASDPPSR